ncbi:MAG: glutamate racemase [Chloroflexota bacterium]
MSHPIGIFDSGVGGLSVVCHLQTLLPHEDLIYIADQAHVPYGSRSATEIRQFSTNITQHLLDLGSKLIVVACNTATSIAINHLRQTFPAVPFVGMEPAVKPAASHTRNGKIGVLATPGTFRSQRYATLITRFAKQVEVWEDPCLGLVELVEAGKLDTPETEQLLTSVLSPMLAQGIDTLVLGCTHYPFVEPVIRRVLARADSGGNSGRKTAVFLIDPAPAVARQTQRLLTQHNLHSASTQPGNLQLLTTGTQNNLAQLSQLMLNKTTSVQQITLPIIN